MKLSSRVLEVAIRILAGYFDGDESQWVKSERHKHCLTTVQWSAYEVKCERQGGQESQPWRSASGGEVHRRSKGPA